MAPGTENKVMHASLRIGDATVMVSDGRCTGQTVFQGFALSLDAPNEARGWTTQLLTWIAQKWDGASSLLPPG